MFVVNAVNCGDQQGERDIFIVQPQGTMASLLKHHVRIISQYAVPQFEENTIVLVPMYDHNSLLSELSVKWPEQVCLIIIFFLVMMTRDSLHHKILGLQN